MRRDLFPRAPQRFQLDASLAIVNIVLMLIFYFLVVGQIAEGDATTGDIALPSTTTLPTEALPSPLLTVSADGDLSLDGLDLGPEELGAATRTMPVLHVLIDRRAPARRLLEVLALPALQGKDVRLVSLRISAEEA